MDNIKVSVIVPIYNVEDYLERCILSLVNQTLNDIEIILVNDESPDNSQLIIDKYKKIYPDKIVALSKKNGGLSDARNYGLKYASGEYISFVDSDDYVDTHFLEKMYNKAISTQSEIVSCGYYTVDESKDKYKWLQRGKVDLFGCSLKESPTLLQNNSPYSWNKIFHRSLFEKTNFVFPVGLIWEDIPTVYPLMAVANKISKVDEPLLYYILKRKGSITSTYSKSRIQIFESLALLNNRYKELGLFDTYYNELEFINIRHIYFRFKEFNSYKDDKLKKEFVQKGFDHLNTFFKDWSSNEYNMYTDNKGRTKYRYDIRNKNYWTRYIYVPSELHVIKQKLVRLKNKITKQFTKTKLLNFYYAYEYKHAKIQDNVVLFESFHGKTISDSPFFMMKELVESAKNDYKIYFTSSAENMAEHKNLLEKYNLSNVELVELNSFEYVKLLARAKYLVNNVSFPPYFIRKEGQKYINTWHGTPLKTLGKKMLQGIEDMSNMQRNFLQATELLFPNKFTYDHMMEDYNLNELYTGKALISGYPRNSIFLDQKKSLDMRNQFDLADKQVFAYMPTWRGSQSSSVNIQKYLEELETILSTIDSVLDDNQVMYVNLHSLVKNKIQLEEYKHIHNFPNVDNYEFLNCVDVLITDYSSVFFDFSITRKPVVLFMYDYDLYMKERGTYFDVRDLPFTKAYSIDELINIFKNPSELNIDDSKFEDYNNTFIDRDSIDSAKIVNDCFFDDKYADNLEVVDYSNNKDIERTLYLPTKVVKRDDLLEFEDLKDLDNVVLLFLRSQFNNLLREYLFENINDKYSYIVVKQNIPYTIIEKIKLVLSTYFKFINLDFMYDRIFNNLLPNIKINKINYHYNPSKFIQRIKNKNK